MNHPTHVQYAKEAIRLVLAHGLAPSVRDLLLTGHREFFEAAALPDLITEVGCDVPGPDVTKIVKNLASLCHFQRGKRGYRLLDDASLSIGAEIVAAAAAVANARVRYGTKHVRPPLSGLIALSPFHQALDSQPGATIGTFLFPSCADSASHWFRAAVHWIREGNPVAARRALGILMHFLCDAGCPHHARGVLLDGHQPFEDACERETNITLTGIEATNTWGDLAAKVRDELRDIDSFNVSDLCEEQALWALGVFGERRHLEECPGNVAVRLLVRSLAAMIRGLEIAGRAA